jgi:transcriptional regulator with XRE-family HTH domain
MAGRKRKDETDLKPSLELKRSLGGNLRQLRKDRGFSQEALAFRAELHRTEISLLERGERDPGFSVIMKLACALEVNPAELFVGAAFIPANDNRKAHFAYDSEERP